MLKAIANGLVYASFIAAIFLGIVGGILGCLWLGTLVESKVLGFFIASGTSAAYLGFLWGVVEYVKNDL